MSPRPNLGRKLVAFRVDSAALAAVDLRAKRAGLDRSEMIRQMLAYADQHMPRTKRS